MSMLFAAVMNFVVDNLMSKFAMLSVLMQTISSAWTILKQIIDEEWYEIPDKVVKCNILSEPEEVLVDVIFIHGLDGAMGRTWQQGTWKVHKNQESKFLEKLTNIRRKRRRTKTNIEVNDFSDCWPKDWMPQDCKGVRIISIEYITGWLWCPPFIKEREGNNMSTRSNEMIQELTKLGVGKRPIVWVGHSKGGLYIKQIIVNAWENRSQSKEAQDIFENSRAIAWYGVPHRGSTLSNYTLPLLRRSVPLLETKMNCDVLLHLHKTFLRIIEEKDVEVEILSFMETEPTPIAPFIYWTIIPLESAEPNIGRKHIVPVNHVNICKPRGRNCYLYEELLKSIKKITGQN